MTISMSRGTIVTPLRQGDNRVTDSMFAGHLARTGHTLVANRHTPADGSPTTIHRLCCNPGR